MSPQFGPCCRTRSYRRPMTYPATFFKQRLVHNITVDGKPVAGPFCGRCGRSINDHVGDELACPHPAPSRSPLDDKRTCLKCVGSGYCARPKQHDGDCDTEPLPPVVDVVVVDLVVVDLVVLDEASAHDPAGTHAVMPHRGPP
jgi:hypothetical protein